MMLEIIDLLYGQNNRGVTRYMRSGSPANDGNGWSSAQHSHSDEPLGSQGRYGSGARSEPQDALGSGRREAPFGPEISWPYGFRKLDPESREVLESAYGTSPAYQQPAMDDFGYGDPGYSDPSYEGPKAPYGNSAFPAGNHGAGHHGAGHHGNGGTPRDFGGAGYRPPGPSGGVPGYQVPEVRDPSPPAYQAPGFPGSGYQPQSFSPPPGSGQDIWPVTGAQEALPDTGPQPALRDGSPRGGASAYPEEWYGSPRLNDRASDDRAPDDRAPGDVRPSRSQDPRLAGMTYGELRYDEPEPGESGYVEPLDEESWYQELRRSAPAYPQTPGGPQGPGSGPQRRAEPSGPAFGQQSGYSPGPDRAPGYGQPRRDGSGPQSPQSPQGPQMSAGRPQPGPAGPAAAPGAGFLSAPVGLLTPPNGTRVDSLRDPAARPAAPAASPRSGDMRRPRS